MKRNTMRKIGVFMVIAAVIFFIYSLNHPNASFPWSNFITYSIYFVYLIIAVFMLTAPLGKK